jgi:bacterioferritin
MIMTAVIQLLQEAAQDEHAAIIQYLRHAYSMGESEEACEIEGIAREEMRHFWMLSRWIVRLGGSPTIARGFVDLEGETVAQWMERDVQAEERAIKMYQDIIAQVDDPALRSDLERILDDEIAHRGDFAGLAEELSSPAAAAPPTEAVEGEEEAEEAAPVESAPAPVVSKQDLEALDWGVRHEYAAVLQYLVHSFLLRDEEVSRQLELQAINEMQHMGWLAEELTELDREMPLEHHAVDESREPQAMLRADISLEHDTAAMYTEFLKEMGEDELKELLERIRDHELYHEELFERLLERIARYAPTGWTGGSLKKEGN